MKVVLRGPSFLASLAALISHTGSSAPADVPSVLEPGTAGGIKIGMPAADAKVRKKELQYEVEDGVVSAIRVLSPRYKTEAGIGVGDSTIALANHYPIRWSGDQIAEVERLNMKFEIKDNHIASILVL